MRAKHTRGRSSNPTPYGDSITYTLGVYYSTQSQAIASWYKNANKTIISDYILIFST